MSKKLRQFKQTDVSHFQWLNQVFPNDPFTPELLFEKSFADPRFHGRYSRVLNDRLGLILAVPLDIKTACIKLLAVHPQCQNQGHGRRLLETLVRSLKREGIKQLFLGGGAPNYLWSGVPEQHTGYFERLGFEVVDESCDMRVPLKDVLFDVTPTIESFAEMGVQVCRASRVDQLSLRRLLINHWPTWIPESELALSQSPETCFVAKLKGRVIAFAVHSANNRTWGSFGPTGTTRSMRGFGLGRLLLKLCLQDLQRLGFTACRIQWVGPVDFYRNSVNAEVSHRFWRMKRSLT